MKTLGKYLIITLILMTPFFRTVALEDRESKFRKGVEYYSESKYQEALDEWTDLYNTGYRSATLSYNIGNAYYKLDNIPAAILFYERAYLLKPADNNINYNLQIVKSQIVDKFNEIPEFFLSRWFDFVSLLLSANNWAIISITTFLAFLIFLSVYIFSHKYSIKVLGFWAAVFLFVLSLSTLGFSRRNMSLVYDSRKAVIFAPVVNGKSSPDASGTDLFVLHEGSKVSVEDKVGEWIEIRLSDGNKGWVPSGSLEII